MPEMFSDFMATFFANMMPYIVLMQAVAYCYFTSAIQDVAYDKYNDASNVYYKTK